MEIPLIGVGTWGLWGKDCSESVKKALDVGYRHIDTAIAYENHKAIAKAIKSFDRETLFITSKLPIEIPKFDESDAANWVETECNKVLRELNTDYLDLLLIHWPNRARPLETILAVMHKLVEKGKIRFPGVSNYTQHHLQDAYDAHLKVPFNQVEMHPYLSQSALLEFCQRHETRLIAFRPFGKGNILKEEPLFAQIGKAYRKTAAQVVLRWITQKNIPVIPKASSESHLKENFNIFDFTLTPEDQAKIDALNKNFRYCKQDWSEFDY